MARVVILGEDWKSRALLRAQLLEEGIEVEAYETPENADATFLLSYPALLVADVAASRQPEADLARLSVWARRFPVWVIGSRSFPLDLTQSDAGFERRFVRPVDVGMLVGEIKQRLTRPPTAPAPTK